VGAKADFLASLRWREQPRPSDRAAIRAIVASTSFFSAEEIDIAVELVDEALAEGAASGYSFLFAENSAGVVGYTCYGRIPGTLHSIDLYWIAVHDTLRGCGLGRVLLERTEGLSGRLGGRRVYIETSARPQYEPTRGFYLRCGYSQAALLEEFYGPGDGKLIYVKALAPGP
jgi:GNAT superfamily N-acetyltransferase